MKTATLPAIRVEPAFRKKAESLLQPGQSLTALLEEVLIQGVETRLSQKEFVERALKGAREADRDGSWVPARVVLGELKAKLRRAKRARRKPRH